VTLKNFDFGMMNLQTTTISLNQAKAG